MKKKTLLVLAFAFANAAVLYAGCGSDRDDAVTNTLEGGPSPTTSGTNDPNNPDFIPDANKEPCEGLRCQQVKCPQVGATTTVSGQVNAPNGTLPLYNAIVFVPNKPLDPVPEGASCDHCGNVSGDPITATITNTHGNFILKNVPVGKDIPLVVQVGKWRRETKIEVKQCVDNPITDTNVLRLPKNSSEGHIPKIAVTTGWCDQLACLLPKLGLDASEYSLDHTQGRLHLYRGHNSKPNGTDTDTPAPAPTNTPDAVPFWSDENQLKAYDMVMLSCECGEYPDAKPDQATTALYNYASAGGRVFASHFHYYWFNHGPGGLTSVADWKPDSSKDQTNTAQPFYIDQSFPKGVALADWLSIVGASSVKGQMPINQVRENVGKVHESATRWVYNKVPGFPPFFPDQENTKYLTVNAPVGKKPDEQCGKETFADMHLYAGDVQSAPGLPDESFPSSCPKELTAEEKALAFLFFDLSSCIQDEHLAPEPPVK